MIKLSGVLVFISFILTIYSYFINNDFLIYSGLLVWVSFIILFSSLSNKKMITILLLLSFVSFIISYLNGFTIDFKKVFTVNQYLLTLLIGVGFLRLIASPKKDKSNILPLHVSSCIMSRNVVHNYHDMCIVCFSSHSGSYLSVFLNFLLLTLRCHGSSINGTASFLQGECLLSSQKEMQTL